MKVRRRLIINADDFGMSHEFNVAISELMKSGGLTSTSLMANGLAFHEAVNMIKDFGLANIGVHLTLTREAFSSESALKYGSLIQSSSICDGSDLLYQTPKLLELNATDEDIQKEIIEQISKILDSNIDITHIDNHMYSLMPRMGKRGYNNFFAALHRLRLNKPIGVRIAKSYYPFPNINYVWSGRRLWFYLWLNMKRLSLKSPDYSFAFPYYAPDHKTLQKKQHLLHSFLQTLKPGTTELHFHPCVDSMSLRQQNPYWENRVHEYKMLQTINAEFLKSVYDIDLISYRQL